MRLREKLTRAVKCFLYGGYSLDVFRLYADEVVATNWQLLKVLCRMMAGLCVIAIIPVLLIDDIRSLLPEVIALIVICLIAWFVGQWQHIKGKKWPSNGAYLIGFCFSLVIIYFNCTRKTSNATALFCGMQLLMCVYILDYPLRLTLVNAVLSICYILSVALSSMPRNVASDTLAICIFFLVNQAVMQNFTHNRLSQIIGRAELVNQRDTDSLTRLNTRACAERRITAALYTGSKDAAMMLFDLDHFKELNDQLGHRLGDQALQEVARDVQNLFRTTDVLCRLGGDEFMIFIPDIPDTTLLENRAQLVVETVRRVLTDETGSGVAITASLGVAYAQDTGMTFDKLYRRADQAMYRAKWAGGNCFRVWQKGEES